MKIVYLLCLLSSFVNAKMLEKCPDRVCVYKVDLYQQYSYKIIRVANNTYGYEIYNGGKLFIRQLTIPGIAGTKGFQKKTDAGKVATLVTSKLSKGIMPPTIDKSEMDHLKIKY